MYKRNDLSLFLLEVWAKSAQTAGFGRIWNSCSSSESKKDFCNLFLGSDKFAKRFNRPFDKKWPN